MKRLMRFLPHVLQCAGAALLAYVSFQFAYSQIFQARAGMEFDRAIRYGQQSQDRAVRYDGRQAVARNIPYKPKLNSVMGRIEIPRLEMSTMVLEGVGEPQLDLGAGHLPGTALPEEEGA